MKHTLQDLLEFNCKAVHSTVEVVGQDEGLMFINDSQEVEHILEAIGFEDVDAAGALFVRIGDGDYEEVWAMTGTIPFTQNELVRLIPA